MHASGELISQESDGVELPISLNPPTIGGGSHMQHSERGTKATS